LNRFSKIICDAVILISVICISYYLIRSIKVNPFDKVSVISSASKVLLIMLITTILVILMFLYIQRLEKYRDLILRVYGVTIVSLYSFSQLLVLRGTKFALGYDANGGGDINKIIEIASRTDTSNTYPPLYPKSLEILGIVMNSSVQNVSKIHMVLFTLLSLLASFYLWNIIFGSYYALILIFIQMSFFTDIGSSYKSFSMWLTYQSIIGLYIITKKQNITNAKKLFVILNVSIIISILSYPAYFLWSFPAVAAVFIYLNIIIFRKNLIDNTTLLITSSVYILTIPFLLNVNFFDKVVELLLLRYKIGDNYIYEGVFRNPFYSPPIILLIFILVLLVLRKENVKYKDLYTIIIIIITNLYVIRLLNASRMSTSNSVELWPRLDKPIFYLFVILFTLIFLDFLGNTLNNKKKESQIPIYSSNSITAITIFFTFLIFASNFGEILINLFPQEGNMAWFSHQSEKFKISSLPN
jgi:hypothetical protein